jgi:hypothetical protein
MGIDVLEKLGTQLRTEVGFCYDRHRGTNEGRRAKSRTETGTREIQPQQGCLPAGDKKFY